MRPDKAKVVDEIWDDARIEGFLDKPPLGDEPADFSRLLYAYRSMRAEDFARFIDRYVALGGDIHAPDRQGISLTEHIQAHRKAEPFLKVLSPASA